MTRRWLLLHIGILWLCAGFNQTLAQDVALLLEEARNAKKRVDLTEAMSRYFQVATSLERSKDSIALAEVYGEIGMIYAQVNLYEKSAEYYKKAISHDPDYVEGMKALADAFFVLEDYEQALNYYHDALGLRIKSGSRAAMLPVMERMVVCFTETGQYKRALGNEMAILELCEELGDSTDIGIAYNNIGYDYNFVGDYTQAQVYLQKAWDVKRDLREPFANISPILLNIGVVYQNMGYYPQALRALLQAVEMAEKSSDKKQMAKIYQLVSEVYYNQRDYYNAEMANERAIQLANEYYQPKELVKGYLMAFQIHQMHDEYQEALIDYQKHLNLRDSITLAERLEQQAILQQQFAYERAEKDIRLVVADKERADLEAAKQRLEVAKQGEEIKTLEQQQKLQEAKIKQQELEKTKQEQERRLLEQLLASQQSKLQFDSLRQEQLREQGLRSLQRAKQEAEDKERKAQIQRLEAENELKDKMAQIAADENIKQRQFFAGIALVSLIIVASILWSYWLSKRKNAELALQQALIKERNAELSHMNEEIASQRDAVALASEQLNLAYMHITDSVRYAQRIQQSLLEPPAEIIKYFADGFILFLPRDIVSGDFYWFSHRHKKIIITAVDCTGHGVPGAFMSLIGNDLLNDIVNLRNILEPAFILEELSEGVRRTLKQDQTENQDGMDMALCVIDPKTKQMKFAGAKNSLVYMQEGEVYSIKGDKMPIGGKRLYESAYTTHTIEIDKPTHFYMFSDGYQDQFGGPRNKKFMIKRLRQLLHDIHERPMAEQEQVLMKALKDWRGREKQVDDVLLMGFKIDLA